VKAVQAERVLARELLILNEMKSNQIEEHAMKAQLKLIQYQLITVDGYAIC